MRYEITHSCGHVSDMETMGKLRGETSATWWIDNKDTADMMLYNACDDVLRKHKAYK